ncbi:energy transducer TonB [Crocinitomix catalasitica]|uniref:energy transducer TonB n=1 Tax=Crocinitomix catalasitica TaxID=184607 RepID=UPI000687E16C|nr:energy transducer TonB [Crocinitomix catalasitica]
MKNIFRIILLATLTFGAFQVQASILVQKDTVYTIVDVEPQFKGGEKKMAKFIQEEVVYPQDALDTKAQGVVYIQFIVEKDGALSNLKVVKGANIALNKEAERIVAEMSNWTPGLKNNEAVRTYYVLPINFRL